MNSNYLIAADLFAVLAVTFMVSLGVLAPLVNNEVLTFIEQNATDTKTDTTAPPSHETALLEVTHADSGVTGYILSAPGEAPQRFGDYAAMLKALKAEHPQDIRLRIDRRVPSGVYQDLLLDTAKAGIRAWQQNEGK